MKKIAILSLLAVISIFTSCEKDPVLGVSVKEISAPFSGNETSVVITANNPWVVQGNEWCVVDPDSGEAGEFTVTLKVKPNETYDPRECDVKVSSSGLTEVIKVIQAVQHVIQPEAAEFNLSGEEQLLTLSVQSNTDVQVSVSAEWIQFKEIKGLESNNLIFNVQENQTKSQRGAEITIKNNEGDVSTKISVRQNALRAYLPEGTTFQFTVDEFMIGKGITKIKFITNSATKSEYALVDGSIYLIKNGETLEIHTQADQFVAHSDCSLMFYGDETSFDQIVSIEFGNNFNTTNVTSMEDMFRNCTSLESLDLSNFNTVNVANMRSVFLNCSSLATVDVSNFNTANVTSMSSMFYGCSSLASLDVSNFNTANVTSMNSMFYGCSSLATVDVSNFSIENVTSMSQMFRGCASLESLDLSNFNTENVTNISSMFYGCSSLISLDLRNFNTENVTMMNSVFLGCSNLTFLNVSNFNTEKVMGMWKMFYDCTSLASLDLSNFNTSNVKDMYGMFYNCSSLASLDLSSFNTANVTDMMYMFSGCSCLTSLNLSSFSFTETPYVDDMFTNTGKDAINKPISIYVTLEAKQYLVGRATCIDPAYAKLIVEGEN